MFDDKSSSLCVTMSIYNLHQAHVRTHTQYLGAKCCECPMVIGLLSSFLSLLG